VGDSSVAERDIPKIKITTEDSEDTGYGLATTEDSEDTEKSPTSSVQIRR